MRLKKVGAATVAGVSAVRGESKLVARAVY
jgi:hypothetical protein